ncbi:MAG: phage tail protein [Armatimonadota bacterium]|nr:phage tail protein [bacterium]
MAVIGSFGQIVFEVSSRKAESFEGFNHKAGARLDSSEIIGSEPLVQFLGPGEETIGFNLRLSADLGVNPQTEYKKLYDMMTSGEAGSLVLGGEPFGGSNVRWLIEDLSTEYSHWGGSGIPRWLDVSVSLRKYVTVATKQ